jgi:DNA-binding response OmpR family regulator
MSDNNRTILHVEDDPNDVVLVGRAVRKSNLNVRLAVVHDGEQAMDYLSGTGSYGNRTEHPLPALVLLDLKLPRKSGFEVLSWIRSQANLRRMRVVMLTSSRQSEDINRAAELGANAFVVKSVDFSAFGATIQTVCQFWLDMAERPTLD